VSLICLLPFFLWQNLIANLFAVKSRTRIAWDSMEEDEEARTHSPPSRDQEASASPAQRSTQPQGQGNTPGPKIWRSNMVVALVRYIEHTQYFELHIPRNAQNKDDVSGKWFQESSDFIMRACPAEVVGFTRERMATCVALKMRRIRALYYRTTAAAHLKWARFYNAFRVHGIAAFTEAIASPKVQDSSACDT
jgi:hypothetical protein